MCTEKQKRYIMGLAEKLNIPPDEVNLEALSVKEAAQTIKDMLAKIKKEPSNDSDNKGINMGRFGLACKLIVQESKAGTCLQNKQFFIKKVGLLYQLLGAAQREISGLSLRKQEEPVAPPSPNSSWLENWRTFRIEKAARQAEAAANCEVV